MVTSNVRTQPRRTLTIDHVTWPRRLPVSPLGGVKEDFKSLYLQDCLTYSRALSLKNEKSHFEPLFGDLVVTYALHI